MNTAFIKIFVCWDNSNNSNDSLTFNNGTATEMFMLASCKNIGVKYV